MKDCILNIVDNGSNCDYTDYDLTEKDIEEGINNVMQELKGDVLRAILKGEKVEIIFSHQKVDCGI